MSFGFAPAISFSPFGFDHGFFESPFDPFFSAPERHYFGRNTVRPRRFRGETWGAPVSGRCVPWRRVARPAPSIFDLISFGSDFDRVWDALSQEQDEVPKIEESKKEKRPLSASSASSPAALPSAASSTASASPSPSEISNKASSEVVTTSTDATSVKKALGEIDTKRDPSATHFDVHLPGLSLGDIKLDFDFKRHALYIKAEKKIEESKEDKHGKRSFVRHVSLSRALPLPDGVKPEDVKADFVDNILSISVAHKAIEEPSAPLTTSLPISSPSSEAPSISSKPEELTITATEAPAPISDASPSEPTPESGPAASSDTSSPEEAFSPASSSASDKKDEDSATVEDAE